MGEIVNTQSTWKVIERIMAIVGFIATVLSCIAGYLVFIVPEGENNSDVSQSGSGNVLVYGDGAVIAPNNDVGSDPTATSRVFPEQPLIIATWRFAYFADGSTAPKNKAGWEYLPESITFFDTGDVNECLYVFFISEDDPQCYTATYQFKNSNRIAIEFIDENNQRHYHETDITINRDELSLVTPNSPLAIYTRIDY